MHRTTYGTGTGKSESGAGAAGRCEVCALADQTIVVGDGSKMNTPAFMRVSTWNDVDVFITDRIELEGRESVERFHVHIPNPQN